MLLEVKNLDVSYGSRKTVEGVDLELERGEILSIVGESGSGKTTVIRAIMGCLPGAGRVSGGDIVYEGRSLLGNTPAQWREMRGTAMSMIFQDSGAMLNPIRTIGSQFCDYIRAHTPEKSAADAKAQAEEMLARIVGIAMAMTFSPRLLLADEPTSALDVTTQAQIIRQIVDVRNEYNAAVIIVTHNLGVASYMSNKIIVMKGGRVVESGPREQVLFRPRDEYTKTLLAAVPVIGGEPYYERAE